MRFVKWISMLTILAMLFAMLPATVAEDEIVIEMEEADNGELEIEVTEGELEGLEVFDEPALSLEDDSLELDGLVDNLLTYEGEEREEVSAVPNASAEFEIDEEGTLTRYGGFAKNVIIPDGVKRIGGDAFSGYTAMESVRIPGSVTYIGNSAFLGCTGLKSITIPKGVSGIGWMAFKGCTGLTSITLPDTLEGIGWDAFSDCTSLKSITIPNSVSKIDTGVFSGCTSLTSIQLPATMTELPSSTFSDCDSLENLDFLSGITKISNYLLSNCDGLKNITIPSSVTTIGSGAFSYCENLEGVTIHSGVSFIDRTAFDGSENVVIRGTAGTTAENYANGMKIPFNAPVVSFNEEVISDYMSIGGEYQNFEGLILYINQSHTLNAVQKPADLARVLSWSSSNNNIATVDQNGTVKAVSEGLVTITAATADGKGKAAQIKVFVPAPTSVVLSYDYWSDNKTITLNESGTLRADLSIPYQYMTDVEMPVTWSSSDRSIISVEDKGNNEATLKANSLGKATITAATPDGGSASMELKVIRPEVSSVKIDQTGPITLHPGDQFALTATLLPEGAESVLSWVSDDTSIVTVGNDGIVTAVAEGYTWIEVYTGNYNSDSIRIDVIPLYPHPTSIKIDQISPILLYPGQQYTLTTTLQPSDAAASLTWDSSDSRIAKVDQYGVVTAFSEGWGEIYVRTDNDHSDSIEVHVLRAPDTITLSKTKATLAAGDSLTLKATIVPMDAETALAWSSSKPAVAKVNKNGKITALKPGKAKITVRTDNGKKASCTITVKPAPTKVKLSRTRATLGVKEKLTLKATLSPSKAYTRLTWRSGDKTVASVTQKGVVTPKKPGTAVITVSTGNGKTARATITVKAAPKSVTLNKSGTVELAKGKQLKLKATLPKNTASALTWKSSKPKVASVDNNGVVTAKAKGTADITVNTYNGKTAKVTVTVK